jgi:hypothetical protein
MWWIQNNFIVAHSKPIDDSNIQNLGDVVLCVKSSCDLMGTLITPSSNVDI